MMLAALVLAAGCSLWHPQVTGSYQGTVVNTGEVQSVDTAFELAPDGSLRGRYVLHERTRDVPGTLTALNDEGCDTTVFQWTDQYGTGVARLRFIPERHCFEGAWGGEAVDPTQFWRSCALPRPIS